MSFQSTPIEVMPTSAAQIQKPDGRGDQTTVSDVNGRTVPPHPAPSFPGVVEKPSTLVPPAGGGGSSMPRKDAAQTSAATKPTPRVSPAGGGSSRGNVVNYTPGRGPSWHMKQLYAHRAESTEEEAETSGVFPKFSTPPRPSKVKPYSASPHGSRRLVRDRKVDSLSGAVNAACDDGCSGGGSGGASGGSTPGSSPSTNGPSSSSKAASSAATTSTAPTSTVGSAATTSPSAVAPPPAKVGRPLDAWHSASSASLPRAPTRASNGKPAAVAPKALPEGSTAVDPFVASAPAPAPGSGPGVATRQGRVAPAPDPEDGHGESTGFQQPPLLQTQQQEQPVPHVEASLDANNQPPLPPSSGAPSPARGMSLKAATILGVVAPDQEFADQTAATGIPQLPPAADGGEERPRQRRSFRRTLSNLVRHRPSSTASGTTDSSTTTAAASPGPAGRNDDGAGTTSQPPSTPGLRLPRKSSGRMLKYAVPPRPPVAPPAAGQLDDPTQQQQHGIRDVSGAAHAAEGNCAAAAAGPSGTAPTEAAQGQERGPQETLEVEEEGGGGEKEEEPVAVVGPTMVLKGLLECGRVLRVEGSLAGELISTGIVAVAPTGIIKANLKGLQSLVVEGQVFGDIVCDRVEVVGEGKVFGDITANSITIGPQATLRGRLNVTNENNLGEAAEEEEEEERQGEEEEEEEEASTDGNKPEAASPASWEGAGTPKAAVAEDGGGATKGVVDAPEIATGHEGVVAAT